MHHLLVFNLYPFNGNLYLPSANIVLSDKQGRPAHIVQRATVATLAPYGLQPSPTEEGLLKMMEQLSPKALEAKFKPSKGKGFSLEQLLENTDTRATVETFIFKKLDVFLSTCRHARLLLTLDAEKRSLVKDVLLDYPAADLMPFLHFRKTADGIEYRFQFEQDDQRWSIRDRSVIPLTNLEPSWILVDHGLYRVGGINGHMVKPFLNKDTVQIPAGKTRFYFTRFIAKTAGRTRIEAEGFELVATRKLLGVRLFVTENVMEKCWCLKPVFEYPGAAFEAGDKRKQLTAVDFPEDSEEVVVRQVVRDERAENDRLDWLRQRGLVGDGRVFRFSENGENTLRACLDWLDQHRQDLADAGFQLAPVEVQDRPISLYRPEMDLQAKAAGDWFDVHATIVAGPFTIGFKELLTHIKKKDHYFQLPDGEWLVLPEEWFTRFAELAELFQPGPSGGVRLAKSLFPVLKTADLGAVEGGMPEVDADKIDYTPGADLKAELRPYQMKGVRWLVGHYQQGFGACLADDMGLGKTLQTIALLLYAKNREDRHGAGAERQLDMFQTYRETLMPLSALIVLPASLVFNWQKELQRFAPSLFVVNHTGPKRLRDARALGSHDVVLTTYHTARQDLALLQKIPWHVVVLDESQQIKNRESEVSKVVRSLPADNKISLSGTPIENSLSDLWSQMEFINPDVLGAFSHFQEHFLTPIEKRGDQRAKERLFERVRPFFLRRTKEEVAPDLPPLTQQVFYSEMAPEQARKYEKVKSAVRNEILSLFDDPKTRLMALQALTKLRQLANHPKLTEPDYTGSSGKFDDVRAQWDTIRRAGHKALFFSSFEKHLQLFRAVFEQEGQPYAWLTGDSAPAERAASVARFQEDPSVQAFFITLKAGGVGLNLTAADYVFVLDPWWNPASEDQAIARAHRIGQERPVTAIRFLSRDTVEEKIRQLQERKRTLGQGLFEAESELPQLTREDLEQLLS